MVKLNVCSPGFTGDMGPGDRTSSDISSKAATARATLSVDRLFSSGLGGASTLSAVSAFSIKGVGGGGNVSVTVIDCSWTSDMGYGGGGDEGIDSSVDSKLIVSENSGGGSGIWNLVSSFSPFSLAAWPFTGILEIATEVDCAALAVLIPVVTLDWFRPAAANWLCWPVAARSCCICSNCACCCCASCNSCSCCFCVAAVCCCCKRACCAISRSIRICCWAASTAASIFGAGNIGPLVCGRP